MMRAAPARWRRPSADEDLFDFYNAVIPNDRDQRGRFGEMVEDEARRAARICLISIRTRWSVCAGSDSVSLDDYPDHWHTLGTGRLTPST